MKSQSTSNEPIAIIGMGCRFPGGADNPAAFWKLLLDGIDTVREVPTDRWDWKEYYHTDRDRPGKIVTKFGGFLDRIDLFDAGFFGISPREAARVDPQQRLLLEVAWEALEDAAQNPDRLAGSRTGVFVGISARDYGDMQLRDMTSINAYTGTGGDLSIAANRVSYFFDFHGPSVAVDTACSSSLLAIHLACQSLRSHESNLALAGGANVIISPARTLQYSKASMLSPDGRCRTFDAGANGYARGEGAGIVALKLLDHAMRDGDPIHAVILATATNQDGRTTGLSLPNLDAQIALLREVYELAGVKPYEVQFVEAHGTGTPVGDPIECRAIGSVLGVERPEGDYLRIGSVKTNLGHLECCSGVASLIKVALALKHRQIPGILHLKTLNPKIDFEGLKLRVPQSTEEWPLIDGARAIAGVGGFGFGGTNAHAVVAAAPDVARAVRAAVRAANVLTISARGPEALAAFASAYRARLLTEPAIDLNDFCYTASVRRPHHDHRLALVASSVEEAVERLDAFLGGEMRARTSSGRVPAAGNRSKVAFLFSGNGPQWWAMGRQLLQQEPIFAEAVRDCDRLMKEVAGFALMDELLADEHASRMSQTAIAQPALFAIQLGLLALWRSWGVEPDAVAGHSVGEVAAACAAGILSLEDAVKVIFHRSRTQELTAGKGRMAAVELSRAEAEPLIAPYAGRLSISAINAPSSVTLSGDAKPLREIIALLEGRQIFCRELPLNYAFHSIHMDPVHDDLIASLSTIHPQASKIRFVSTVTGSDVAGPECVGEYWWDNIRKPVLFSEAIDRLAGDGYGLFVEIGPHPVLASYVAECASALSKTVRVLPSLRRKEEEELTLLGTLGALYTAGYNVQWERLYPQGGRVVQLPSYPWQRERHWHDAESAPQMAGKVVHPLLGYRIESAYPQWQGELDLRQLPYLRDHVVQGATVFPGTGYIEMAISAATEIFGNGPCGVEDLELREALTLGDQNAPRIQLQVSDDRSFKLFSQAKRDSEWRSLVQGRLVKLPAPDRLERIPLADVQSRCAREIAYQEVYREAERRFLQYGPAFRSLARIWAGDGEALGEISLAPSIVAEVRDYHIHPAILDACSQVVIALLPNWGDDTDRRMWVPVKVDRFRLYTPADTLRFVYARHVRSGAGWFVADYLLLDEDGNLIGEMRGFRVQGIDLKRRPAEGSVDDLLYEFSWRSKQRSGALMTSHASELLGPSELIRAVRQLAGRPGDELGQHQYYDEVEPRMHAISVGYIRQALRRLGWVPELGQPVSVAGLIEQLGIQDAHQRLTERMLQILEQVGDLRPTASGWQVQTIHPAAEVDEQWRRLLGCYPSYLAELTLLGRCGRSLADVLTGVADATQVVFPEKSGIVEQLYEGGPTHQLSNRLLESLAETIVAKWPGDRKLRILEIGGGTGGATSALISKMPADAVEYVFTDVSNVVLSRAEQKFRKYPSVEYRVLDIEQDPADQGFPDHSFDIIVASHALHATRDLTQALANIQRVLASEGLLVIVEATPRSRWLDLVFGLLKTWWHFTGTDLRAYPLLGSKEWVSALTSAGFSEPAPVSSASIDAEPIQAVILARGQRIGTELALKQSGISPAAGGWLAFCDEGGVTARAAQRLSALGQRVIRVIHGERFARKGHDSFTVNVLHPEEMQTLVEAIQSDGVTLSGILHGWSLDAAPPEALTPASLETAQDRGCLSVIHLVQALRNAWQGSSPRLWILTGGAQSLHSTVDRVSLAQTPVWGLGRVILTEHPTLRCTLVDLSASFADTAPSNAEVESLVGELLGDAPEEEILLRGSARYVNRLQTAPLHERTSVHRQDLRENETFRLEIENPGVLESLSLRAIPRISPGRGEVEIEVQATGLNFKDVLQALGVISGEALEHGWMNGLSLGFECAGRIVAIGPEVEAFAVGDQVMAFARSAFAGHVIVPVALVSRKPVDVSIEEAATIPVAFLTAYYALHRLGRLRSGDRVLIHGAAGGVGLAAVQIAQQAGGVVFGTAGSPEKRELLRALGVPHVMDSRSLAFAQEITEITGGEGVDIVLNSVAGEVIPRSLSILKPFGRFLEIGKRDLLDNTKLGLRPFERCLSFHAIDVDQLMLHDPQQVRELFDEVTDRFDRGELRPLPYRLFALNQAENAFRTMQQSRHIGKIVVSMGDRNVAVQRDRKAAVTFREDASYLITGGLGGVGLLTARWMVANGARHLVLVGRRGATTPEIEAAIEVMRASGADVLVRKVDVVDDAQVAALIGEIRATLPPLRGVLHSVLVMDDGILLHLNRERFMNVVAPKVIGGWNLHVHTRDLPLDFFVLHSSLTSILGKGGQASYAAANAFLDVMPAFRRAMGLPGLTINWGALAEVGWLARHDDVNERVLRDGARAISPQQALEALGRLLVTDRLQVGVLDFNWEQWFKTSVPSRFSELTSRESREQKTEGADDFHTNLEGATEVERKRLIESRLCGHVASVLGASASRLDIDKPITSLGLDSLMAVELQIRIHRDLGVEIPVMNLLQQQCITDLAGYVASR